MMKKMILPPQEVPIRIAKRDNNPKRSYLLVNPLQGKHFPVVPSIALSQFHALAEKLYARHKGERLLLIGFAETATAIGAAVAAAASEEFLYLQTTREQIPGTQSLHFSEAHSHATEQSLIVDRLEAHLPQADRIVFIEDEVTTGNTITNLVAALRAAYGTHLKFGAASLLCALPEESLQRFEEAGLAFTYLTRLALPDCTALLARYSYDADLRFVPTPAKTLPPATAGRPVFFPNPRVGVSNRLYADKCNQAVDRLLQSLSFDTLRGVRVLVLGCEEFVYPPLLFAHRLELTGDCAQVTFHATTRSPILPSSEADYPFFNRYTLRSLYDEGRITYLYNLRSYDRVFIFHDAESPTEGGLRDLYGALEQAGCDPACIWP